MTMVKDPFPGFKFGCDPELFVVNGDGEFVTADGLIPGTKEEPFKVECGAVQVDGMAAEFNTDPAETFEEFDRNITAVMRQLKGFLPAGHKLVAVPSAVFSEQEWDRAPDHAKILGCTPDFNAWTGAPNPSPHDPKNPRLRTASGHVHLGWTDGVDSTDPTHVGHCSDLVKQLDWFLGLWSLQKDPDPVRRKLYGKAGACRYKPYGVEYRVLSNFWVTSKDLRRQVWNRMQAALYEMSGFYVPGSNAGEVYNSSMIHCIDNSVRDAYLESAFRYPALTLAN